MCRILIGGNPHIGHCSLLIHALKWMVEIETLPFILHSLDQMGENVQWSYFCQLMQNSECHGANGPIKMPCVIFFIVNSTSIQHSVLTTEMIEYSRPVTKLKGKNTLIPFVHNIFFPSLISCCRQIRHDKLAICRQRRKKGKASYSPSLSHHNSFMLILFFLYWSKRS